MEDSPLVIQELNKLICKDFQTDELAPVVQLEEIRKKLVHSISYLLDKDMNRLLAIFYRIDLKEDVVRTIITQSPVEKISVQLADLVIERELQKVRTRMKYKNL